MFNPNATDIDGPILFSPENEKELDTLLQRYPYKRAALLPVLYMAQAQFGWLSPGVMAYVAQRLELPEGKVLQVASFYTIVPCCMMGGFAVVRHISEKLGIGVGETTADGRVTLLEAECLAGCGYAPLLQVNGEFHENLTPERIDALLATLR